MDLSYLQYDGGQLKLALSDICCFEIENIYAVKPASSALLGHLEYIGVYTYLENYIENSTE